eukprot:623852-Prymnesium_polylepis.1
MRRSSAFNLLHLDGSLHLDGGIGIRGCRGGGTEPLPRLCIGGQRSSQRAVLIEFAVHHVADWRGDQGEDRTNKLQL